MRITRLESGWTVQQIHHLPGYHRPQLKPVEPFPAQVPGAVHLDLVRNSILADPFSRRFELAAQWVSESDWAYETSFSVTGELARTVLHFEGLDTLAQIFVNGKKVGQSDNFFCPLTLDVTKVALPGDNTLRVELLSPVQEGEARRRAYFEAHQIPWDTVLFDERAFVRKPGYSYGWDWGPRLVGLGIWRPVQVMECEDLPQNLEVTLMPLEDNGFEVRAWVEREASFSFEANSDTSVTVIHQDERSVTWHVVGPLWWPRGYGDQPLHTIRATSAEGQAFSKRIGLRTAKLLREPDGIGESFEFEINGRKVCCMGANWIPNNTFPGAVTDEDLRSQIETCAALNFNMLRVWGGGMYESDSFYDACDELGIMVWQDFPYACMYYPDDEPYQALAEAESKVAIRRLRHRPSLVLWCGNNENLVMWQGKWSGPGPQPTRYFGENIYEGALRRALASEDSQTSYIPSSPIGHRPGESDDGVGDFGDAHYWDVWHGRGDWKHYRDCRARFSSEFGFASSCSLAQWKACLAPEDWESFPNPVILAHDKTGKPWETFLGYVTTHYPEPATLEDWTYYSQLNQRDALRCGIETLRRSDFCRGSLIWQLNDSWPATSWAVQDYRRHLKPAGFDLRRLYSPVALAFDYLVDQDSCGIWVANDGCQSAKFTLTAQMYDTVTAAIVDTWSVAGELLPGSRQLFLDIPIQGRDRRRHALKASLDEREGADRWQLLAEPKDMHFGPVTLDIRHEGENLHMNVSGFVADLVIWDDADHARIRSLSLNTPGWEPITACNETLTWFCNAAPQTLRYRHLGLHSSENYV